ncbi:tyrosine-type recombinase/integrase [Virgibacillus halodenitrificans]|uniref:tyrosine-type recombinase/integrase n=1 Tax=Virgibacillus halodenitrificans TaxID=1482 RepID=UPI0013681FFC|nr:tyrosine-type recombinase/integrase [Virgibacillus halodenitrificans]MYL44410.1 tyrosine-type recombinase/integrase [Virgibacillus halodenitrificans]
MAKDSRKGKSVVRKRRTNHIDHSLTIGYTIDQAFEHFISLKKSIGVRDRTMTDYINLMKYFLDWLSKEYPDIVNVEDISTKILREYIVYLKEEHYNERKQAKGLSPFTINVRIRFLKGFFNTLFKEEIINKNPVTNIQLMRVDEDSFEPLTDEEIDKILDMPDIREYAQFRDLVMMYLMLDTGMRISEVCELEVKEVDFKTRAIILPATKNKNRKPRILPLSNSVVKLLMELVTENRANFDTEYVFVSNIGTKYNPNSFRKRLFEYKREAGIEKRVSPHIFRHMFCRNFILSGGDIFTLQRIVGHANITTTRKYIQMDDKSIRNQHSLYSPVLRIRNKFK